MRGGCRSFALVNMVVGSILLGCGERDTDAAPATASVQAAGPAGAPADTSRMISETTAAPVPGKVVASRDSLPALKPAPAPAAAKPPRKAAAAPKPAAPAPRPTPPPAAPSDTPPPEPTAPASDSAPVAAQANAPLRDDYHRAPLDTVSQQVYDGWKQYNLNCARCHGEDVQGTTIAPHLVTSLQPNGPINTKQLFVKTVCDGRPERGMPAWCPLGMEMKKIEAIHAYVKGRSDGKVRPGRPAVRPEG